MDSPSTPRIYTIVFLLAASLGVGYLAYRILAPFLAAIAWATVLAVAFRTPWAALERRMSKRRGLAAALMTTAIALVFLLPAGLFAGVLANQIVDVAGQVNDTLQNQHVSSVSDIVALPAVAGLFEEIQERAGISQADFQKMAAGFATRASAAFAQISKGLVLGAFDAILTIVVTIFVLFFFFRDGARMSAAVIDLVPTDVAGRAALQQSFGRMVSAIFRGSFLCSLVQGLSGAIGWWIAGLPSPALAGAAMAVFSLVPMGGTAIVWIPGSLWAWYSGNHGAAIFLFLWGTIVTAFLADNVLRPLLIGGSEELSPLVVFLGVFGGLTAFGILGIFIGPVTLALGMALVDLLRRQASPVEH